MFFLYILFVYSFWYQDPAKPQKKEPVKKWCMHAGVEPRAAVHCRSNAGGIGPGWCQITLYHDGPSSHESRPAGALIFQLHVYFPVMVFLLP